MKPKGIMSVKQAVLISFNTMAEYFYGYKFSERVKSHTGRPLLQDQTIMRHLRLMKQKGLINYKLADEKKGYYQKLPV